MSFRPLHRFTIVLPILWMSLLMTSYGQGQKEERAALKANEEQVIEARKKRKQQFSLKRGDLKNAKQRALIIRRMKEAEDEFDKAIQARAKMKGIQLKGIRDDGIEYQLVDFDENDLPVYIQSENENAAISTATDAVRSNSSYGGVEGAGVTIGLWEASGIPRITHQEYSGRITVEDGTTTLSGHAAHVAGTLIASGVNSDAMGMAPAAEISAFAVSNLISELLAYGAIAPNTTQLYLSNHSYGVGQGWEGARWSGTFVDDGNPNTNFESDFGRYSFSSEQWDDMAYNLPYHLTFISAGNQRSNDAPDDGDEWTHGATTYTYDSSQHPQGDGDYKDGWDNMEGRKLAKNAITVGNTADAVTGGVRDPAKAVTRRSSSRGPVDDGRIKPDIVANGDSVFSANSSGNSSYSNRSGTSMASPNACGSAALLIDYYSSRFPNAAMRASTLKALILHTADDDGNPGPDYRYGWGLMNTKAAADVIKAHADNAGGAYLLESVINDSSTTSEVHAFAWDGSTPLRVTLCWTDPAGAQQSGHDNRTKTLVNDLNLKMTGPNGTHYPYVMPHVGNWSVNSIDDDATTGINDVDNVEQVYLAAPVAGDYLIEIDYAGTLTNSLQEYSLIVTGQSAAEIEVHADGAPLVALSDNIGTQNFGSASPSAPSIVRNYTIRNTGGSPLTGLTLTQSGSHGSDFTVSTLSSTVLNTGEVATFSVSFDPLGTGTRSASIQIASNDVDEAVFDINLSATGLTELEAWRLAHFGTTHNNGNAADSFDFDKDGQSNLIEFALGTDPTTQNKESRVFLTDDTTTTLTYFRSIIAMSEFDYQVMWSENLQPTMWFTTSVTEQILSDDGTHQEVEASVPVGNADKRFFRLRISPK